MADRERALLDHAAECSDCHQVAAKYQTLRRAIRDRGPRPAAPAGFADRVIASVEAQAPSAWPIYGTRLREPLWPIGSFGKTVAAIVAASIAVSLILPFIAAELRQRQPNGPAVLHNTPFDDARDPEIVADGRS